MDFKILQLYLNTFDKNEVHACVSISSKQTKKCVSQWLETWLYILSRLSISLSTQEYHLNTDIIFDNRKDSASRSMFDLWITGIWSSKVKINPTRWWWLCKHQSWSNIRRLNVIVDTISVISHWDNICHCSF